MNLKKTKKSILTVVLSIFTLLFFLLFTIYYSKFKKSENQLTILKDKEFEISFQNNNYSINESKFLDIITEHSQFDDFKSKGYNFTEILDTILKKYQSENKTLTSKLNFSNNHIVNLETKIKSMLNTKKDSTYFLLLDELETQKNLVNNLTQELHSKNHVSSKLDTLSITSPKGDKIFYFGKTKQETPNGYGIGFYAEKGYYAGEWKGNLRHGKGKHFYKDGAIYEGFFENYKREGFGIYQFNKNEFYEGMWQNDLMHGEGKIIGKKNKPIEGVWKNGKLTPKK